jgi:hypothetical protein
MEVAFMAPSSDRVEINLAAIPVRGFGGACLVVTALICAAILPQTRWFMAAGIAAGVLFGISMIVIRQRRQRVQ